ncbi:MAG: carbohydrate kinase family protein [Chloroflexi bacterium]|nr:carbohydrate kinase family protein [Chloroflexota bacterium]
MSRELDVVVLGGAAVDWVARVDALPERDSLVLARACEKFPGGSAANVAVGLARLGCSVGFVGKLGDDEHGQLLLAAFEEEGVETRGVIVEPGCPSAVCFIAVDDRGERMIVALPGAAVIERVEELDLDYVRRARAVYIGPSYPEVATAAAAAIREGGGAVFCAPGGVHVPVEILGPILERTDVLLVSRTEALAMAGRSSPDEAARALRELGPQVVVETLGAEGVLVASDAGLIRVPAFDVPDAQDTTGAGDGFAAGLIAGFLEGLGWEAAARMGCAVAALKIRHVGARSGLPSREEVKSLVETSPCDEPGCVL